MELAPKALQILTVLVGNPGQVVSKDDLLRIVWPGAIVEEGNLSVHIFALRKALGADSGYIETVPKRGYRFAAPVRRVPGAATTGSATRSEQLRGMGGYYVQQQTARGCVRAAAEYRESLRAEPRDPRAKAGLANTFLFRFVLGDLSRDAAVPRAKKLLEDAAQIDPACSVVHLSRSRLLCLGYWQWERGEEELQRAWECAEDEEIRSLVRAWQGCYLVERGQLDQGLRRLRQAHLECPLSSFIARFIADAHFLARDFSGCVAVSRRALEVHPHVWMLYRSLGRGLTALGEFAQARRQFRRASLLYDGPQPGLTAELAYLEAAAGNGDRAGKLLERLRTPAGGQRVSSVSLAQIHAALGDRDRALDCLDQACANRDWSLSALKQDPRFDPIRTVDRYRKVLKAVGI